MQIQKIQFEFSRPNWYQWWPLFILNLHWRFYEFLVSEIKVVKRQRVFWCFMIWRFFFIFQVVDVRINNKGVAQSRNLTDSQKSVPNFGFVVFEDEKAAMACLTHKPINLPNGHRLNVETKKKNVILMVFSIFTSNLSGILKWC